MRVTVIGTGYVGLVTGACLAEMGNHVTCVDIDRTKIENLKQGVLPIYEPGLESIVTGSHKAGLLKFTTDLAEGMERCEVCFIAVGTPPGEDGSADLSHVVAAATGIGKVLNEYCVVVDKSTVPVGTADKVRAAIRAELDRRGVDVEFDVASNPEFLKEGAAVEDFRRPDRLVIGIDSERARKTMHELYAPFVRNHDRFFFMGVKEAELTKYAANAMLATRISFMNEISVLCDRLGVDVESVRLGIGSDSRIGYSFLYPGCGYGGSCFPKDVQALMKTFRDAGVEPGVLQAVEERNRLQKKVLFDKITAHFEGKLGGRTFGMWGLAFKPGTDDLRQASSRDLLGALHGTGARVRAFDPAAMDAARREFPRQWFDDGFLTLAEDAYSALDGADALVLVTEWKQFRSPDFQRIVKSLRERVVFDGRNQFDPAAVRALGFDYYGIGR
jgi:UDPglucose 6-dehydrogenase